MSATERELLLSLCEKLGAPSTQAGTMADQLIKRRDQLATERGWTQTRAMEHLLTLLVKGRSGEPPPGFEGGKPPGGAD